MRWSSPRVLHPLEVVTCFFLAFLFSSPSHWGSGKCLHWKLLHFALGQASSVGDKVKCVNPTLQNECSSCHPPGVALAELTSVYWHLVLDTGEWEQNILWLHHPMEL